MKVVAMCRDGAMRGYACINYNATGERLASLATGPDHTITVWDWRSTSVILRCAASSSVDVQNVVFSKYNERQLVTAGSAHISFWSISRKFIGLKVLGQCGRFAERESSNVSPLASESFDFDECRVAFFE